MTIEIIGSDIVGTSDGVVFSDAFTQVRVQYDVTVTMTVAPAITISGLASSLRVNGDVASGVTGIQFAAENGTLSVGAEGSVESVVGGYLSAAVDMGAENQVLNNLGSILANNSIAVRFSDDGAGDAGLLVNNFSSIAGATGIHLGGFLRETATVTPGPVRIFNNGDITGHGTTLLEAHTPATSTPTGVGTGIYVDTVGVRIFNILQGRIVSSAADVAGNDNSAISIGRTMVGEDFGAAGLRIINYGEISSLSGTGIDLSATNNIVDPIAIAALADEQMIIQNFGTISGVSYGIRGGRTADFVTNGGLINGDVDLGTSNDRYNAVDSGVVVGTIRGGLGEDTLRGGSDGDSISGGNEGDLIHGRGGDDVLQGNTGADTILGGDGDDTIDGGTASDLLFGNSGDDYIFDDGGNNTMSGGLGDDTIQGGRGHDSIMGNRDDDLLSGANGNDTLLGGTGADTLTGGGGADVLIGGADADVFVWSQEVDSGLGSLADVIMDFEAGVDVIDLSGLPATLSFVGAGLFTGAGTNEVRTVDLANGSTRLVIDVNGDGWRDMHISIDDVQGLTAADFIL